MSDQRGFTVIELIVTMAIAMIVLSAAGRLIVVTQASNARIEGRVDASQRGRVAMESMTQELRAMVCLPDQTAPVVSATPDSITWYADLDANPTFNQEQRRLTAVRDGSGNLTSILEERWVGITPPTAAGPNRKRTLITNIRQKKDPDTNTIEPVFSYYAYPDSAAATPTTQLAGTVLAADLRKIVRVDIAFRSLASTRNNNDSRQAVDFEDSVYARTVRRDNNGANQPTFDCTG